MNKKILKIFTTIIYILFIISMISNTYATISDSFGGNLAGVDTGSIEKIISDILFIIRMVGTFVAVAILMVIACKYMIASAGDRADIKKYAMSYIIGALILFATSGIAGIIRKTIEDAFSSSGAANAGTTGP